jgi:hypothetical protein
MRTLEIIHLRMATDEPRALVEAIVKSAPPECDLKAVYFYRRRGLALDLAIHIVRTDGSETTGPSDIGARLASALQAHGLVEHTLWDGLDGENHETEQ